VATVAALAAPVAGGFVVEAAVVLWVLVAADVTEAL
jgi:hypothetical protein